MVSILAGSGYMRVLSFDNEIDYFINNFID